MIGKVDEVVQRWFDRRFTWLMERGVSKRLIRWHLWTVFTSTMIGGLALFAVAGSWRRWVFALLLATVYIGMYGWLMHQHNEADLRAEGKPFRSLADDPGFAAVLKLLGIFDFALLLGVLVGYVLGTRGAPAIAQHTMDALHALASISIGYLCGPPPVRPKPREERVVLRGQAVQP